MYKNMRFLWIVLLASCGGESIAPEGSAGASSSSSSSSSSSFNSSSSSSSDTPAAQKSGQEYYQQLCQTCHGEDGRSTAFGDMNVLTLTEDELYAEILLTMPAGNAEACDQACSIKVKDYIRGTLFADDLAAIERVVGVKPTKLLASNVLGNVLNDTFAPINIDTSPLIDKLPEPLYNSESGFNSNAGALMSDSTLEDFYEASIPIAKQIAESDTVIAMCSGGSAPVNRNINENVTNRVGFMVPADGQWHVVNVNMASAQEWYGDIRTLRIDGPPNGHGSVEIDHIQLVVNGNGIAVDVANWNTGNAEEGQQINQGTASYGNGAIDLALSAANNDPYIRVDAPFNIDNADTARVRVRNNLSSDKTGFEIFFALAPNQVQPGVGGVTNNACASAFIDQFATKAFRHTLSAEEKARLMQVFQSAGSRDEGLLRLAQVIMLAPNTLYQLERIVQGDTRVLSGEELAERLAMFLWGSIPDAELLNTAGQLQNPAVLVEQAERMLNSPKATSQIHNFVKGWLKINEPLPKPDFGLPRESANALSDSLARFFDFMLREEEGTLVDLYTDNRAFVTPEVADIYGVPIPNNASTYQGASEVLLPKSERAGIITRAGFVAGLTGTELTSPTKVGHIIRERILCQHIPPPSNPDDANIDEAEGLVGREFVKVHNNNPACAGCHAYLDNIGLLFENYDPVGKYRTAYGNGEAIDPSGYYASLSESDLDQQGDLADSLAFSVLLSQSDVAAECLAKNIMQYALDRSVEDDPQSFEGVMSIFVQSNYQLKDLVMAIVQSNAFTQQGTE